MDANGEVVGVRVEIEFAVRVHPQRDGSVRAYSKYGSTTAPTKEECIRILKERAKNGY